MIKIQTGIVQCILAHGEMTLFYILLYMTAVQELLIKNYHFTCCFKTNPVDTIQIRTAFALVVYKNHVRQKIFRIKRDHLKFSEWLSLPGGVSLQVLRLFKES